MQSTMTMDLNRASVVELVQAASAAPLLDAEREAYLGARAGEGDAGALEHLVLGNLRIAVDEAIRNRGLGTPQDQLLREGVRTLMASAVSYDPKRHGPFSRYAARRIRAALSEGAGSS